MCLLFLTVLTVVLLPPQKPLLAPNDHFPPTSTQLTSVSPLICPLFGSAFWSPAVLLPNTSSDLHIAAFISCQFMYLNLCIKLSSRPCKAYENASFICLFHFTCWTQAVSCSPQKCPLAVFVTWRTEETYFWEYLFKVYFYLSCLN